MNIDRPPTEGNPADFLKDFQPEGPWCLTAINPDKKGIETKTFTPETVKEMETWLAFHNGRSNLYFHTNRVNGLLSKKAEREQIKFVDYLHVDVDPAEGKDIDAEQSRILAMFGPDGLLDRDLPPPTFLIFSGGGYQAFWKLDIPFPMDGTIPMADEVARYNRQLEKLFGGDSCHNIDRLMRLPWTMNIPTVKKRKAGRVPALARVVQNRAGVSRPIENFLKAPLAAADRPDGEVDISDVVQPIDDLAELDEWNVPDKIKQIIAQGRDPDNPKVKDNSRSAWLWHVLMALARLDVPPQVMFALITDKQWGISASVREQDDWAKEAKRQINKAIVAAVSPELVEMNDKYFCVLLGGKFRIGWVDDDQTLKRRVVKYAAPADLNRLLYANQVVVGKDKKTGNPVTEPVVDWWMKHPKRRTHLKGVTFDPSDRSGPDYFNLWQGFPVAAKPGDCSLFKKFMLDVVCNGDPVCFDYLWKWSAWKVQNPEKPTEVAVVLKGGRGTGKGTFARVFGSLFGEAFFHAGTTQHLVGQFNSHLRTVCVMFMDEACFANDPKANSVAKFMITEPTLQVEAKGVDIEPSPNCMAVILATNDKWAVSAGADERRYFVLRVSERNKQSKDYFKPLYAELDAGGREALMHELYTTDLGDFHPREDVPQTAELGVDKIKSLDGADKLMFDLLQSGDLPWYTERKKDGCVHVTVSAFIRWAYERTRKAYSGEDLRAALKACGGLAGNQTNRPNHGGLFVPALREARAAFEASHGLKDVSWPEDVTKWGPELRSREYNDLRGETEQGNGYGGGPTPF